MNCNKKLNKKLNKIIKNSLSNFKIICYNRIYSLDRECRIKERRNFMKKIVITETNGRYKITVYDQKGEKKIKYIVYDLAQVYIILNHIREENDVTMWK